MCVAIYKPAGKVITDAVLFDCYKTNSDGAGFACIDSDGKIFVYKTMVYTEFLDKYKTYAEKLPTSPFIIHFRIATHGKVDTFNCHPFIINNEMAFIHNGVIRDVPACPDKLKSDTQIFNEQVLQVLPPNWETNAGIKTLIEKFIFGSKLAVLHVNGTVTLFNEKSGTWEDGVWFSNMLWKTSKNTQYFNNQFYTPKKWCWECGKEITYNIYSNTQKVNFCCAKCKAEYDAYIPTKNNKKTDTKQDKQLALVSTSKCCVCRGDAAYEAHFEIVGKKDFCDAGCLNYYKQYSLEREQKAKKETTSNTSGVDTEFCFFCKTFIDVRDLLLLETTVNDTKEFDFICIDCVGNAIKEGIIEEDEATLTITLELIEEREERSKRQAMGGTL